MDDNQLVPASNGELVPVSNGQLVAPDKVHDAEVIDTRDLLSKTAPTPSPDTVIDVDAIWNKGPVPMIESKKSTPKVPKPEKVEKSKWSTPLFTEKVRKVKEAMKASRFVWALVALLVIIATNNLLKKVPSNVDQPIVRQQQAFVPHPRVARSEPYWVYSWTKRPGVDGLNKDQKTLPPVGVTILRNDSSRFEFTTPTSRFYWDKSSGERGDWHSRNGASGTWFLKPHGNGSYVGEECDALGACIDLKLWSRI
jgi:hypothetical protein